MSNGDEQTLLLQQPSFDSVIFTQWGTQEIGNWLNDLQFQQSVSEKFAEHNITGEILPYLNDNHFDELDINVKDRIKLKIEINKLISSNNYIQPNELHNLKLILSDISDLITTNLNDQVTQINDEFYKIKDELTRYQNTKPLPTPELKTASPFSLSPTKEQSSNTIRPSLSTTQSSNHHSLHDIQRRPSLSKPTSSKSNRNSALFHSNSSSTVSPTTAPPSSATTLNSSKPVLEPLKQLRASTDDPCSKILQAAMKRHKLNDDWRNYALVICYGDKERILELDEKPVLIFKELKERGEHPAIMLRQKADFGEENKLSETPGGKL
ncbi:hypothetical protein WICMUC_003061 [Wickerhamomyces mucosus]|uniref:Ras-associating domain-containing protein n=1 Tax=Wickerhamomyces mucosus TaxID=1378264 RepID=A0A9P8PMI0_9ASCO|nr:hypothetical protein WICMUC_003061 [Wickerhamomyces mucosus]